MIHQATESGSFRVEVAATSGRGTYQLVVDGVSVVERAPEVIGISPDPGQWLRDFPDVFRVTFSEQIAVDSVQADSLTVNDEPAVGVRVDGRVVEYQLATPAETVDGLYSVRLRAGGVRDLQGGSLAADFPSSFELDQAGPRILQTYWNGEPLPDTKRFLPGSLEFTADLSEDLFLLASARRGPLSPGADDVLLVNRANDSRLPADFVEYDPEEDRFTAHNRIEEGNYSLQLLAGPGAFEDRAGNALDGEPLGTSIDNTPTGDGAAGGDYRLDFVVDADVQSPNPFVREKPWASLISRSLDNRGFIHSATDQDALRFHLQAGELLSARVEAMQDATLTAQLWGDDTLYGSGFSASPGAVIELLPTRIPVDGFYELRITADRPTYFDVDLTRNAASERSLGDTDEQNELAIDDSFVALGSGRLAVIGYSELELGYSQISNPDQFIDISAFGTGLDLGDDDEATIVSAVGNRLMSAGKLTVANNGGLISGSGQNLSFQNLRLPTPSIDAALFPYWDDLGANGGDVYYAEQQVNGINTLIVQWQDRPHFLAAGDATFQVQLFETGNVLARFVYSDIQFGDARFDYGGSATIGVQLGPDLAFPFSYGALDNLTPVPPDHPVYDGDVVELFLVPDVDQYTMDLQGRAGQRIDILLSGLAGSDFSTAQLDLLDAEGNVLAAAVSDPLGAPLDNADLAILGFVVPDSLSGLFKVRVSSLVSGQYSLVVGDAIAFETEPNDGPQDPLRVLAADEKLVGYLTESEDLDRFAVDVTAGQTLSIMARTLFDRPHETPVNSLDLALRVLDSNGVVRATADADSLDGKTAQLQVTTPETARWTIEVVSSSGEGEYVLHLVTAPRVTSVRLGSSQWTESFRAAIDPAQTLGYPLDTGTAQLATLPWSNLDRIYLSFDEELAGFDASDLSLVGGNGSDYSPQIESVTYANRQAVIAPSSFLPIDKLLLVVHDRVTDREGNRLDGEWQDGTSSFPSGDGVPGGAFHFRLNVAPGDANQSGGVSIVDLGLLRDSLG